MQMRKTNHSYKSNKSNVPKSKAEKGRKHDMYNDENEGDMLDDENDSNDEIDEQSPNDDELDEEDNFITIDNKKALTPSGGSHNNLHQDKSRDLKDSSFN
jgi:hypothetical protein